jgi:hypothetical protein
VREHQSRWVRQRLGAGGRELGFFDGQPRCTEALSLREIEAQEVASVVGHDATS